MSNRVVLRIRLLVLLALLAQFLHVAPWLGAQEGAEREAGVVVGTTGLNIRECPDVTCGSQGLAQLRDPIIVTGPPENGYLPVQWAGKAGWAWHLYVATPSRGTPFLEKGTPGCNRVAIIVNIGIGEPLQIHPLLWLKEENVPATIFPMGWWALAFPDDMRTLAMLGFPIGSHGDVRLNLTGFSDEEVITDIRDSAIHIRQVTGKDPVPYFTPYAADMDERVRSLVASEGYLPVAWDVPADDWGEGISAEYVFDRVVPKVEDGSIVEFHLDGPSSAQATAVALPWIVEALRKQGYQFVTIQDMAQPCPPAATPVSATPLAGTPTVATPAPAG
ncbi:MAG: polysaccharide deacetylase family protein [Chloroflexi bacterium]|nr:polysaccharide deacetylase family protein [Chloroflexota bacterium]